MNRFRITTNVSKHILQTHFAAFSLLYDLSLEEKNSLVAKGFVIK